MLLSTDKKTKDIRVFKPKECFFCKGKSEPSYKDSQALRKFISDRLKILPRLKSGLCSKHQRYTAKEIKHARHLALLPFVAKV